MAFGIITDDITNANPHTSLRHSCCGLAAVTLGMPMLKLCTELTGARKLTIELTVEATSNDAQTQLQNH